VYVVDSVYFRKSSSLPNPLGLVETVGVCGTRANRVVPCGPVESVEPKWSVGAVETVGPLEPQ